MLLGCVLAPAASAQQDEVVQGYMNQILAELGVTEVECPQRAIDEHPGQLLVCANYGGRFSAFKADWEAVLRKFDFRGKVVASDAWSLKGGIYRRVYAAETASFTVIYHPDRAQFLMAYDPNAPVEDETAG